MLVTGYNALVFGEIACNKYPVLLLYLQHGRATYVRSELLESDALFYYKHTMTAATTTS